MKDYNTLLKDPKWIEKRKQTKERLLEILEVMYNLNIKQTKQFSFTKVLSLLDFSNTNIEITT